MSTIGYYICVPFAWVLRTFYELTGSYGWALVLFTIVVKLITLPFQMKSKNAMRKRKFQMVQNPSSRKSPILRPNFCDRFRRIWSTVAISCVL